MEEVEKRTVNEVIRLAPEAVTVFGRYGIDSCCGGGLPVEEAARRHGADLDELLRALGELLPESRSA